MASPPDKLTTLKALGGRSIARLIRFVRRTSHVAYEPPDLEARLHAAHPIILATWHGQFMMTACLHRPETPVAAMVARHGDAELIGAAMEQFGVDLIRGAGAGDRQSDRGGAYALRAAVKALKGGSTVVMTADVPPGPARLAGEGIVMLARLSGRPIVPVAAATSRFLALGTWSRMTINLPFSKLAFVGGEPIFVPGDADAEMVERLRRDVEQSLNDATRRAYKLAGADVARITPPGQTDRTGPPAAPGLRLKAYRLAASLMRPVAKVLLRVRERQGKEDGARRGERLGEASVGRPRGPLVWFHAASVGETNAVLPLIDAIGEVRPNLSFLLTTGTTTSAGLAGRRLSRAGIHQYVPLDAPEYAARFLDHWRPNLAVFTESEIWPNLILETSARNIPIVLVNGRLSRRTYGRWRKNAGMSQPLFNRIDLVLAQNDKFARWFGDLGARSVIAAGNLKIDAPPPPIDQRELERLGAALAGRPLLVAASTHEGEEEIIAESHRKLARALEGICTIIAPRHPERGTALSERLKGLGFNVTQRSLGLLPDRRTDIYIADTIGELGMLYALAPVAFIGGSLIERGGQNPIEAVRHEAVVLVGPHWQNFRDAYRALQRHNGMIEIRSAEELAHAVEMLAGNDAELKRMRADATQALATLTGALNSTVGALLAYIPDDERLKRAS